MRVRKFFHSASNTHIFFQPDVGVDGIRGAAPFSDLAFRDFMRNLESWVSVADENSLRFSEERLENSRPDVRHVKEFQVRVPERIKDALKASADREGVPLGSFIVRIIKDQLAGLSNVADATMVIKGSRSHLKNEQKCDLSFRMEGSGLVPLARVAQAGQLKEKDVVRSLIMKHFAEMSSIQGQRRAAAG